MAAFKQFLASDVIVTPFEVNKGFTFESSSFGDPDVQIWTYQGYNTNITTNNLYALNSGYSYSNIYICRISTRQHKQKI